MYAHPAPFPYVPTLKSVGGLGRVVVSMQD